jgi:hypothetical protein
MPCSEEHLKKLDAMLDSAFPSKKEDKPIPKGMMTSKDCDLPKKDSFGERIELRTGGLSKRNPV